MSNTSGLEKFWRWKKGLSAFLPLFLLLLDLLSLPFLLCCRLVRLPLQVCRGYFLRGSKVRWKRQNDQLREFLVHIWNMCHLIPRSTSNTSHVICYNILLPQDHVLAPPVLDHTQVLQRWHYVIRLDTCRCSFITSYPFQNDLWSRNSPISSLMAFTLISFSG